MLMFVVQSDVNVAFTYGDSTTFCDKRWRGKLVFYLRSGVTSEANLLIIRTYCGVAQITPGTQSGLLSVGNVFGEHT